MNAASPIVFDPRRGARWLKLWWLRQIYHRAELVGAERIPADGPVLLVSNHGRLDFDVFILTRLLLHATGRFTRSLADRIWFRSQLTARIAANFGAVEGRRENAVALLNDGDMVLTYPGGVREIMQTRFGRSSIDWTGRTGFAKVAMATGATIVPVAGFGINNGLIFLTSGRWLGHILYRWILRMDDAYRDPLAIGLIPLPLPFSTAVHFPLPCKVRYVVGDPIRPPVPDGGGGDQAVHDFAATVAAAMQDLIRTHGTKLGTRQEAVE